MQILRILALTICLSMIGTHQAHTNGMGIVTGSDKGTYYQIGLNLAALLEQFNPSLSLNVLTSNGSLDNIADVFDRPGVQMGIVQSDALTFIRTLAKNNPNLSRIADKVRVVFPLYNEEIHIVANSNVRVFSDLDKKKVAIGQAGSGSFLTSRLLFEITGIEPQMVLNGGQEALNMLLSGEVDAMIYVAGYPVQLLKEVPAGRGIHIVPIEDKSVMEYYYTSTIPALTYPWQTTAVTTAAVKAAIVSYDYRQLQCSNVGMLAKTVYEHLDWLKAHGHPKWQQVDLDFTMKNWEQYQCVKNVIHPEPPGPIQDKDGSTRDTLRDILNSMGR
ncbi:hypothetical protein TI04_04465 [Achromatium sp. WMS2]|nr:hypothetical protein TI04_04465 [Achromatium sp. WMS2]